MDGSPLDILSGGASAALPQQGNGGVGGVQMGPAPLQAPPPLPQMQPLQQNPQQNHFHTVGERKRSDRQQLTSTIANAVKQGSDYVNAKKTRTLQMHIQSLIEASQARDQAVAILQQDPQNAEAKKALEFNTGRINDITKDPKINKQLQKAFNIDLFGNGKNKLENKAFMDAMTDFQKKQQEGDKSALNPVASRILGSRPQQQQLSPQAQMEAQLIKAGIIPKAGDTLKAGVEIQKSIASAKSAEDRNAALVKAAQIRADAEEHHSSALLDAANVRALGTKAAAEIRSRSMIYTADKTAENWTNRIKMMREIATGKDKVQEDKIASLEKIANDKNKTAEDKLAAQKELNKIKSSQSVILSMAKEANTYNTELQRLTKENKDAQTELDKKGSSFFGLKASAISDADAQILRNKIENNNLAMQGMQGKLKEVQQKMKMLNSMGLLMLPEGASEQAVKQDNSDDPENLFGGDEN